jgi:DNA-binding IclR family transcriptional regulator
MTTANAEVDAGTASAARVADVLLLFLDSGRSLGVTTIARQLGLSKAVVHRIVVSLVSRGLLELETETRRYRLGPAAAAVGARALRELDPRAIALPVLRRLRDATEETTTLSLVVKQTRVYVEQVESPQEIRMLVEVGRRFPLHAGSSSKAILAFLPPDEQEQILTGELPRLTPRTITDRGALRDELAKIRADRVATSSGERQAGAGSVAAPLLGLDGYAIGAISVCGPAERFGDEQTGPFRRLVREGAQEISEKLGARTDL